MDQTSIFEYLDTLKLQITDPLQKQMEYYHQRKSNIASNRFIVLSNEGSPQTNHQYATDFSLKRVTSMYDLKLESQFNQKKLKRICVL